MSHQVHDYSPYYLACRQEGREEGAVAWRRAEWATEHMADLAEQEERRWWRLNKEAPSMDNPKAGRAVADGKDPLDYLESAVCDPPEARVMKSGADKYGRRNFRDSTILATTYVGAIRRHLNAFASGEDTDPDSGEPHLAHIRACCAVLLSAQDAGTYEDDRGVAVSLTPEYNRGVDELAEELYAESLADLGAVLVHQPVGDDKPGHPVTGRHGFTRNCPRRQGELCECWISAGRPHHGVFAKKCGH